MIIRRCEGGLEIAGHTDAEGDAQLNLRLSQQRADQVAKHLVRYGVSPDRVVARGYGESQPLVSGDSAQGAGANRRIEFRVLGDLA